MAKRKTTKKSMTQQAIGLATIGLPAPVQQVATSRWGSRLLLILVPILLATGVLSIRWVNGMPTFSFDADRAAQVRQQVELQARRAAAQLTAPPADAQAAVPTGWGPSAPSQAAPPVYQPSPQPLYQSAAPQGYPPQQTAQPFYPAYR